MSKHKFNKLRNLIKQNTVFIEVSKTDSSGAFGGTFGAVLFTVMLCAILVGVGFLVLNKLFMYAAYALIVLVILWFLWSKLAFYYFYVRSVYDYKFFCSAYNSGIIRLRVGEEGALVEHPMRWMRALDLSKKSSG